MHSTGVNCPIAQLRRFRVLHGSDYRVQIITSRSVIADLTTIAHPVISGQSPVTGRGCNTDRLIAAYYHQWRIRCHPSLVWQFWGRCPLPSVTRQAILGQVPTAVHRSSGNFRAGAHCHPLLVRRFLGQVPIAGRCYLHAIDCLQGCYRWSTHSGSVPSAAPAPCKEFESVFASYRQVQRNRRPFFR